MATGKPSTLSLAVEVSLSNKLTGSCLGVCLVVMKHNDQKQLGLFHLHLPSRKSPSQEVKAKLKQKLTQQQGRVLPLSSLLMVDSTCLRAGFLSFFFIFSFIEEILFSYNMS